MESPAYTVAEREGKGRCTMAARDIRAGERLISAVSEGFVVTSSLLHKTCSWCFFGSSATSVLLDNDELDLGCDVCGVPRYCSKECKQTAAALHSVECKTLHTYALSKATTAEPPQAPKKKSGSNKKKNKKKACASKPAASSVGSDDSEARLAIQILCRCAQDPQVWERVSELASHHHHYSDEHTREVTAVAQSVVHCFEGSVSVDEVVGVVARARCNAMAISNTRTCGVAVCTTAAILNHSCLPNCVYSSQGATINIQAVVDIPAGTELCITYTTLTVPANMRRQALLEQFYFECSCERCSAPPNISLDRFLEGYMCSCEGLLPDIPDENDTLSCELCGKHYARAPLVAASDRCWAAFDHANLSMQAGPTLGFQLLEELVESADASRLHPLHSVMGQSLYLLCAYRLTNNVHLAAVTCTKAIRFLEHCYGGANPTLAHCYLTLASVMATLAHTLQNQGLGRSAMSSVTEALRLFCVSCGADHPQIKKTNVVKAHIERVVASLAAV